MPSLEPTLKGYAPILIPILSIVFAAGGFVMVTNATARLTNENKEEIKSVDSNSRDRDWRINEKIDKNQLEIKQEMTTIKENQARLIARQDMVIDTLREIKQRVQ